jgi:acetyl-CoA synthetase
VASLPPAECWPRVLSQVLDPRHPFEVHRLLFETVFSEWDESAQGPPPAWFPTHAEAEATNIATMMESLNLDSYPALHAWSAANRADFWEHMVTRLGIRLRSGYRRVLDLSEGAEHPRWLVGAELNIADSCFNASPDAPAIVHRWEAGPDSLSFLSYRELLVLTNRVAGGLRDLGLSPGDAVAIDMPMTAESVAVYLGIVKAGCVVVSIADSFAPDEIAVRLRLSGARAIFTQDFLWRSRKILPLFSRVVEARAPRAVVLSCGAPEASFPELRPGDVMWDDFLADEDAFDSVARMPSDPMNVLFSSGTTGEPKVIPWTQITPIKCAADGYLHHDIRPADVVAWPTNIGWMMGPWLIYASLINRGTLALYDGPPTGRKFGEFVQDARVNMLGVVPSLVRTWRNTECMKGLDWSTLRAFSSTGECSNPDDMFYLMSLAGYRPIVEYCGGTEIGGGYITGTVVQPAAPAAFTTPALGLDFAIFDAEGHPTENGEAFLVPPSIGLSTELLNKDHHTVYFEGSPEIPDSAVPLRRHGDHVERLPGGFYRVHGRVDDTMNLGGIKVSSAEIEQVLNGVEGVRETAAVAVSIPSKLVVFAVPEPGADPERGLKGAMQSAIKEHLNPLFRIHDVVRLDALPRTASNKIMRRVLRERYDAERNPHDGASSVSMNMEKEEAS